MTIEENDPVRDAGSKRNEALDSVKRSGYEAKKEGASKPMRHPLLSQLKKDR